MAEITPIDELVELPEGEFLDELEVMGVRQRALEVQILRMAYAWAVRHPAESADPAAARLPGREQGRAFGGDGTPRVAEFAAAVFGTRLGLSPAAGRALMADALDLRHRFPRLWERVEALEVRTSYARYVVRQCRELDRRRAAYVDARVAESADGRISWARFEHLVAGLIVASDLEAARAAEARAARATFTKRTRGDAHGMATFFVRADVAVIEAIQQRVSAMAARLDETHGETADERRVAALLHLVAGREPGTDSADLLPRVHLFVHTYSAAPESPGDGIARIEGHGAVTDDWVRDRLGPRVRFTIRPVLDLAGQAPVDSYEIPDGHRRAVRLMTPFDVFPFANATGETMQIDHTVPYGDRGDPRGSPPGQSRIGNYGPMTAFHHRVKTHGGWQVQQPFAGIYVWRDPYGGTYLVDHTGTRRLRRPRVVLDIVDYTPAA